MIANEDTKMLLVVDCNALCWKAFHTMDLSYEGAHTGVMFGFLRQLLSVLDVVGTPERFVFTWDSNKSWRKVRYLPTYKSIRKQKGEELDEGERERVETGKKQFTMLRDRVLPEMGFNNVFMRMGYEADDLIASVVLNEGSFYDRIIMVTDDKDMLQMLQPNVFMFNHRAKTLITNEDFEREWGLKPIQYGTMLSIAGCSTDEVPGVSGVGLKTAAKYLRGDLKKGSKVYERINGSQPIIYRNEKLVRLPFEGVGKFELKDDELDWERLEVVFEIFGFRSFSYSPLREKWEVLCEDFGD